MSKVEIENKTGIKELDAMIAAVSKKFGKDLSGNNYGNMEIFTSGSLVIDIALKRGGFPTGTVIEIFGPNSSFKTTLAVIALANRQKWRKANGIDKRDLIVDLEHSLEESFLLSYGVDLDLIIWERPDSVEEALQLCIDLPKSGFIDYVLFDSVDAGQNEKQTRRNVGETDVGGISKDMNFALRQISKIAPKYRTTFFFINQIKMNPGVMFGSPETTPGGLALGFYANLRLRMKTRKSVTDLPNSSLLRFGVVKTKMCSDVEGEITAAITWGEGYNEVYEINKLATELGLLKHSAGISKIQWASDAEHEYIDENIDKGKQACLDYLAANERVRFRLRHTILRATGTAGALSDEDAVAYAEANFAEYTLPVDKPEEATEETE